MSRVVASNPWVGLTYIPDNTRMETPPAWFLQQLHDYDADLVILPSRMVPFAYVIARRKKFSAGLTDKALMDTIDQKDTKMCMKWGLVPVSLMYKTGPVWSADSVLRTLRARDLWAHGGADKVADMLEEQERDEKRRQMQAIRSDLWDRSGDAYRSYKRRTGQAVSLSPVQQRGNGGPRGSNPTPLTSAAGLGAQFSSRD